MGSVNPIVVTEAALAERSEAIAEGLAASVASFGGQLCTKPGVVFVPAGEAGDAFAADLGARLAAAEPQVLLNERLRDALTERVAELGGLAEAVDGAATRRRAGLPLPPRGLPRGGGRRARAPRPARGALRPGRPAADLRLARRAARRARCASTASSPARSTRRPQDAELVALLAAALGERSGRLIFDGFPTGVAVTHGMHHGGPFPATTAPAHTSVGMTAIRRFLRPVAFQNAPAHVLPPELQDANPLGIWRRVDGELTREPLAQSQ